LKNSSLRRNKPGARLAYPGLYAAAFAAVFFLCAFPALCAAGTVIAKVRRVVDGDTVVIEGGEKVRYVGIDTPERGEPFYGEAKKRNISLVAGRQVRLVVCDAEPRDKYGRLLAFVYAADVFVNRTLVEEGLARRLIIPPCGLPVAREFRRLEQNAREKGLGLWAHRAGKGPQAP